MPQRPRILTGDRPTGNLHIGHYFGSLENRRTLQQDYDTFVLIADIQALTDNFSHPEKVATNVWEVFLDNLAAGISPAQATFFLQSAIQEIAELTVFFSNLVTIARLQRNPTVKTEITQKHELFGDSVTFGFLGYPVSQAADITVVKGQLVPVGEDQLPMIEQTREIVEKFNRIYGNVFPIPEAKLSTARRIKGIDGNSKMGKSLNNAIYLVDDEKTVSEKVMSAVTDPQKIRKNDPGHPDICTVCSYHELFSPEIVDDIKAECTSGARGCVQCKRELSQHITNFLAPMQERRRQYEQDTNATRDILRDGTAKARSIAQETLAEVKDAMHLAKVEAD